jgi:hypothetical protein
LDVADGDKDGAIVNVGGEDVMGKAFPQATKRNSNSRKI